MTVTYENPSKNGRSSRFKKNCTIEVGLENTTSAIEMLSKERLRDLDALNIVITRRRNYVCSLLCLGTF